MVKCCEYLCRQTIVSKLVVPSMMTPKTLGFRRQVNPQYRLYMMTLRE